MIKLMNVYEVSNVLGMTPNYILNCCSKYPNRIPKSFKLHNVRRWKESDVVEWIEQRYKESVSH